MPNTQPASAPRQPGLDTLRAAAVLWVMLFHSWLVGGLGDDWQWLSRYGWMGVDLFFVLSGYLIGRQLLAPLLRGDPLDWRGFYWRRAWRILPAYAVVLALYAAWPAWREAPGLAPWWAFLTFTLNLVIDYETQGAFSHAWSLCVEEHFYLLFPWLAAATVPRWRAPQVAALLLGLVLAGIALRSALWWHGMATDPTAQRNWFLEDLYYPSWCRLDGLLAGVALAAWQVGRPQAWARARRHAAWGLPLGAVGLALACGLFQQRTGLLANSLGWPVLSLALAALVWAAAGPESALGRWRVPGAAALAAIAYPLYLVHKPVYHLVQQHAGDLLQGQGVLAVLAYGGAAVVAAALLHLLVERPGLRWRDRLRPAGQPRQAGHPRGAA